MARCTELEADLAALRAAYDMYFQGNERIPPSKKHDAFKKALQTLKGSFVRQTAAKFRIESIAQKLQTYERLWERTMKEIENGTYKRDLARIKRRHSHDGDDKQDDHAFHIDEDLDMSDLDEGDEGADDLTAAIAAAEAAVSKPKPAATPPPPAVKAATGVAPAIAPAITPAITPVTPPGGLKPATGVQAALKPATPTITPAASPPPPSLKITAAAPVAAKTGTGVAPTIAPAVTGATPALKPASTGVQAALKPASTGVQAALKPAGATGAQAAFKPAGATGSNPALKPAGAPAAAARPPGSTGSTPALRPTGAGPDGGLSDQKIKAIFDAYVMAKKRCGEDTRQVTLDSVSATLKKQVPELMKTHKAKSVEFKVVIKDGKAVLRALPKEE